MPVRTFVKKDVSANSKSPVFVAWNMAKTMTVITGILLLLEFTYFAYTTSSSFEITLICIFIFGLLANIPLFYSLYKSSK
ncbi:MAG: hypothetical protein ACO1N7_05015 [Sphingobacteriaceae bacterium]